VLAAALLFRRSWLLPWAIVLLGGEYAGSLFAQSDTAAAAPVYAAGLLLVAELGFWALEPLSARDERASTLLRATTVAVSAIGAGAAGLFLVALADVRVSGGLGIEAVGLVAAALAVAVVVQLARSRLAARL
jgi:hypothetical protein